jgi:hypothetical protein
VNTASSRDVLLARTRIRAAAGRTRDILEETAAE